MKDLLKKIGATIGAEEAVDAVTDEADKASPGLGRKLLITLVAASVGAVTTWGLTIDQRVYSLSQDVSIRQTIAENQSAIDRLEQRLVTKNNELRDLITRLETRLERYMENRK